MAIYSVFSHKKIVIVHSYVSLPEGNFLFVLDFHVRFLECHHEA
jgi:hypothetical protein